MDAVGVDGLQGKNPSDAYYPNHNQPQKVKRSSPEYVTILALTCEVCGNPIKTPSAVEIDGAVLRVCQSCARLGRPVTIAPRAQRVMTPHLSIGRGIEPEFDIDPEYTLIVRHAREKLGLTQEALGRMINVKPSVISHIETGKMKPDMVLARTLMHHLKVSLLVPSSDLDSNAR